jgi:hypothetical protein
MKKPKNRWIGDSRKNDQPGSYNSLMMTGVRKAA